MQKLQDSREETAGHVQDGAAFPRLIRRDAICQGNGYGVPLFPKRWGEEVGNADFGEAYAEGWRSGFSQ